MPVEEMKAPVEKQGEVPVAQGPEGVTQAPGGEAAPQGTAPVGAAWSSAISKRIPVGLLADDPRTIDLAAEETAAASGERRGGELVLVEPPAGPSPSTADLSDVDAWGRSERTRLARTLFDPVYRHWFRAEWEGLEQFPATAGPCWWPTTPEPSLRRRGHHARHRVRVRPAGLRPGRLLLPRHAGGRARCGPGPEAWPPIPTTPSGSSTTRASWSWSSPKAPRARPSSTRTATG